MAKFHSRDHPEKLSIQKSIATVLFYFDTISAYDSNALHPERA